MFLRLKTLTSIQRRTLSGTQWNPNVLKSPWAPVPVPEVPFTHQVWANVDNYLDQTALVCGVTERTISYSELRSLSRRIGAGLATKLDFSGCQGIKTVATLLYNDMDHPAVLLGALEAGLVVSSISSAFSPTEIAYQLKDSGARAVVTHEGHYEAVQQAKKSLPGLDKIQIILTGDKAEPGAMSLNQIAEKDDEAAKKFLRPIKPSPEDIAMLPYSSGTTGLPKGVMLTNRNLVANNLGVLHTGMYTPATETYQEVVPVVLPLYHIYGHFVTTFSLSAGAKLIMLPKFEEKTFLNALLNHKTTILFVAPPLLIYLGNSKAVTREHLETVKMVLSGAAPLSESDIQKCVAKSAPGTVYAQGYGLTETSPLVCVHKFGTSPNHNSAGKPAVNTLIKIVDIETGQAMGAGDSGEIWVQGPQVMKGYWNNPKATEETFSPDNWLKTGDIGYYDDNSDVYVTDRLKELIKVKGFQVAPAELEAKLREHPLVQEAGVTAGKDPVKGEVPIAFVSLKNKETSEESAEKQLREYLKERVAFYKEIEKYIFIDLVPKSPSGKILRKDLRALYNAKYKN